MQSTAYVTRSLFVLGALALGGCVNVLGDFKLGAGGDGGTATDSSMVVSNLDSGAHPGDSGKDGTSNVDSGSAGDSSAVTTDSSIATDSSESDSSTVTIDAAEASAGYPLTGSVTGLATGASVVLANGSQTVTVSANGSFSFPTPLPVGTMYTVTVMTQPAMPSQTCTVSNGMGTIAPATSQESGAAATVTVTCMTNSFTVGGSVTGLNGSLTLQDNAGDNLTVTADGAFTFATPVPSGMAYAVTILTQPTGQTCTLAMDTGTVADANITVVAISCVTNSYKIGGTVSGLASGSSVTLVNNAGDAVTVSTNTTFTFTMPVPSGGSYNVTIMTQPTTQTCNVSGGAGTVGSSDITTVVVNCAASSFTIGGTVSGLAGGDTLAIEDNGGDQQFVSTNGPFTFPTPVSGGAAYAVTVVAQPASPTAQTCAIVRGTGMASANVSNVSITCTTNNYAIGGTVSGVCLGSVTIKNGSTTLSPISANGSFSFMNVPSGTSYNITATPSSSYRTCQITNGTGTLGNAAVTNISIECGILSPSYCGLSNGSSSAPYTSEIWCSGNCSSNHAQYANWYCQLAGCSSAASYNVLTTNPLFPMNTVPCLYYEPAGATNPDTLPLTSCSQLIAIGGYGLNAGCDAVDALVCE